MPISTRLKPNLYKDSVALMRRLYAPFQRNHDRILFMDAGQVLERATPDDFFNRPQSPRAQKFLSDIRTPFAANC